MKSDEVKKLDTGISWKGWAEESKKGKLCGILGCYNKPMVKCEHCGNYYCQEHEWVINTYGHKYSSKKDRR